MSLNIQCPLPTALSAISPTDCAENFAQVVRLAFQRSGYTFTDITDETEWDTLIAAADDTKIVLSPFCENVLIPAGELITEGGDDNTTLFGQPVSVGKGTVTVTGRHRAIASATKRDLDQFLSESSTYNALTIYLLNEFGQVIAQDTSGTGALTQEGFPINNYFISDVDSQGFNTNNLNNFSWTMGGGWSDFFEINDLTWDILAK